MSKPKIELVAASWTTAYTDDVWAKLQAFKADTPFDVPDEEQSDWLALGPSLPDENESRIAVAIARRHLGRVEGDGGGARLKWSLTVQQAPEGEPVERIRLHNKTLGGRPGLMRLLSETEPGGTPQVGRFLVKLVIEEARWKCRVLPVPLEPGGLHAPAAKLGRGARIEQVGYRYESGVSGLEEISIIYVHDDRTFAVSIHANGTLRLGSSTWLPYADEIADLALGTFFFAEEGGAT